MTGPDLFDFQLDGATVNARPGETILQAAQRQGAQIPRLCHTDGLRPDGNCRACVVEIEGERTLAPSCCRTPAPGQKVRAQSPRARKSQEMVLELLLADMPEQGFKWNDAGVAGPHPNPLPGGEGMNAGSPPSGEGMKADSPPSIEGMKADSPPSGEGSDAALPPRPQGEGWGEGVGPHGELSAWAARLGVTPRPALAALRRDSVPPDLSHPAMAVNLDTCIQCNRCQRACREEQVNDVIGMAFRGEHTQVVFDLADPMGASTCVACGECVQACPTGALMPKTLIGSTIDLG